jgi:hypothetical protein
MIDWFELETIMIPQYVKCGMSLKDRRETAIWFSRQASWIPEDVRWRWVKLAVSYGKAMGKA